MPRLHYRPRSYFWKILSTIGVISVGFLAVMLATIGYYMVIPLGQRATDDLASIIFHAAETWQGMPQAQRPAFADKMLEKHHLVLTTETPPLPESDSPLPYLFFLERSLEKQLGRPILLRTSEGSDGEQWFWADIPVGDGFLRFGFPRSRIGVNPSIAFLVVLITGFSLTFVTATLLTHRLTGPIEHLYQAARQLGSGRFPEPVPEEGPEELAVLAREFNRMNTQVRELLASRTTLLAGISHDLRTPLTQIQLALAMLPNEGGNPRLMAGIRRDLEVMNRLITQALEVNRELGSREREPVQVEEELEALVATFRHQCDGLEWHPDASCCLRINRLAFRRVLSNLLENAIRYGDGKPVRIDLSCTGKQVVVDVLDRGPGIPPEQREAVFQPFFRLEGSRSTTTGGSGLGLAIVRQLAGANGWVVRLLPRDGGGTRARLEIPLDTEDRCPGAA